MKKHAVISLCLATLIAVLLVIDGVVIGSQNKVSQPIPYETDKLVLEEFVERANVHQQIVTYIRFTNPKVFPALADLIADAVLEAAHTYDLKTEQLVAIIRVESAFRYYAQSNAGCIGLAQVNPAVWVVKKDHPESLVSAGILTSPIELYDPLTNIMAGAHILRVYLDRAKARGAGNPFRYAVTRYCGNGCGDFYFKRVEKAMAEFKQFAGKAG